MTSEWELLAVAIMLLTIPMHSIAAKMNILFFIIVFFIELSQSSEVIEVKEVITPFGR